MLTELSLQTFFRRMAASGAPGGGSGAAVLGLTGVSLMEMVEGMMGDDSARREQLRVLHKELESCIDRDAEALDRALPALTAVGPDGNIRDWNAALMDAVGTPFAIADHCIAAIEIAKPMVLEVPPHLVCDLKFASMSCYTALQGAILLADLNISLLRDDDACSGKLRAKSIELMERADIAMDLVLGQ